MPILWRGCRVGCLAFLGDNTAARADEDHLAYGVSGTAPLDRRDGEEGADGFDIDEVEKLGPADEAPESACSDSEDSLDLEVKAAF